MMEKAAIPLGDQAPIWSLQWISGLNYHHPNDTPIAQLRCLNVLDLF